MGTPEDGTPSDPTVSSSEPGNESEVDSRLAIGSYALRLRVSLT